MNEVIIVRISENDEITYEIRNENNEYVADCGTLEEAVNTAMEFAEAHQIEHVKIQVETESV